MEREVVNSSRRNHLEAARARKRIEELTGEFSLFREKVLSDDEDGTILMFRDRNTSSDDTLSSFPSSSSSSASSSSIIQTNFSFAKTTARGVRQTCVRLAGSCIELGEWDVKRSVELQKVDDNDNLYTCSIDMSVKSIDDFKFKFFTCTENIKDIDWQASGRRKLSNAIDGRETIALNFTVDWMGNNMEERVWVCRSLER